MPRDRLAEFHGADNPEIVNTAAITIEMDSGVDDMSNMREFFREVDEMKTGISTIKKKVQNIEQVHGKALTSISGDESGDKNSQLDQLMDDINVEIQNVRSKLKQMELKNQKLGATSTNHDLTAEQRIRMSQHGNVTKKFIDVVSEYQEIQTKYKNKYRDRLERQYKIVKPNATSDEIDKVMESGADASTLFAQQILMGPQHAEAKRALYDIQERHQDIVKIEKSILELHQLFLDMAVLVDAQGDMINQIEHYVQSAADHTNKGVEEMKKAVKSQKRSRKRMCCILFLLLVLIVVVAIVLSVLKSQNVI